MLFTISGLSKLFTQVPIRAFLTFWLSIAPHTPGRSKYKLIGPKEAAFLAGTDLLLPGGIGVLQKR